MPDAQRLGLVDRQRISRDQWKLQHDRSPADVEIFLAHLYIHGVDLGKQLATLLHGGLLHEAGAYVGVAGRHRPLRAFYIGGGPMQQSALRAVGKSLVDGQVGGEHRSHLVRPSPPHPPSATWQDREQNGRATRGGGSATPVEQLLRLERRVEVASEMQQPAVLRSDLGADEAHALVRVPVLSACATSPHLCFELHSMVMRSRHAARDAAIPSVPVPPQSQAVSLEASGIALFVLLIIGQLHNADDDYGCCDLEQRNKRASRQLTLVACLESTSHLERRTFTLEPPLGEDCRVTL